MTGAAFWVVGPVCSCKDVVGAAAFTVCEEVSAICELSEAVLMVCCMAGMSLVLTCPAVNPADPSTNTLKTSATQHFVHIFTYTPEALAPG